MTSRAAFAVLSVAYLCAAVPAAVSGPREELARCTASIVDNRPVSVTIAGHSFKCPGQIIVGDEAVIQKFAGFSANHAYFQGALVPRSRDKVMYYVVVENWADPQKCRLPLPLVKFGGGAFHTIAHVPDSLDQKEDELQYFWKQMEQDWKLAAQTIVKASARKWAESFEFSRCKRDWPWQTKD